MYNLQRILIAYFLIRVHLCHGNNWHFSVASMKELFDLENEHAVMVETYIKNEYKRLEDIRCFIEQREKQNAKELSESYTESSINAFKTILRVKNDWETLKNQMTQTTVVGEKKYGSVTYDNIVSAFKAMRRLQIIYEINTEDMSKGKINDHILPKLDVDDCYQMASICYNNAEYHCAHEWFNEVYKRYKIGNSAYIDNTIFISNYVWSSYLIGNIENAIDILHKYENEGHELTEVLKNIKYMVWSIRKVFKRNTANDLDKRFYSRTLKNLDKHGQVRSFINACQRRQSSYVENRHLKCRYHYGNHKFYIIGPLREESISIIPKMELYHNVLYDDEIQKLKHLATSQLERLEIDTNEDISLRKVATFNKYSYQVFNTISNRLSLIPTRSNYVVSNKFVVTNYGLSGHYLPHNNYIDEDHLINSDGREAMIILHMDDIPKGGYTVVPEVHVEIPSTKGSALVVYSTQGLQSPFGEMMFKYTQYGSCPMFEGDKWTLTGWLEEK